MLVSQLARNSRITLTSGDCLDRFGNDMRDGVRRGHDRRVVGLIRPHMRIHANCHEMLRFRVDHQVLFGDQEPAWTVFPQRAPDCFADTRHGNRTLHRGEHRQRLCRGTALYEAVAPRGVVVPPDNLKALTAAITALTNDAERRAALGKAARVYAEQTLSPESTIRTFEERLAMLLREVGGKRDKLYKRGKGGTPSFAARPSGAAARRRRKPATAEEAAPD